MDKAKEEREQYLAEWIERIKRGEDIAEVRKWFLTELAKNGEEYFDQLTPLNKVFLESIFFNFQEQARLGDPLKKRPTH